MDAAEASLGRAGLSVAVFPRSRIGGRPRGEILGSSTFSKRRANVGLDLMAAGRGVREFFSEQKKRLNLFRRASSNHNTGTVAETGLAIAPRREELRGGRS